MKILGIESSCDDTSVAFVNATNDTFEILSEKTASQIDIHKKYGGVVPEIAGRAHAEKILPLIEEVLQGEKPDVIAVTSGPGLITGLLVGIEAAKTLSYLWDIPLIGVNHIEGHIHSTQIASQKSVDRSPIDFPAVALIASGGHTELILMSDKDGSASGRKDHGTYELIGKTRDDAAGEAFDKVAKLIGFDYPGGPKISEYAEEGNPKAISFPRPMLKEANFDFSFSGLKTAALYWLRDHKLSAEKGSENISLADFCASFEQAIVNVLVQKTSRAAKQHNAKTVILGGGVSANKKLRNTLEKEIKSHLPDSTTLYPLPKYAMDNAAMIAMAAYNHAKKEKYISWKDIKADPNWKIYKSA